MKTWNEVFKFGVALFVFGLPYVVICALAVGYIKGITCPIFPH